MASIRRHPLSGYWIACFTLPDGRQTQRSTRIPIKGKDARESRDNQRQAQERANLFEDVSRKKLDAEAVRRIVSELYQHAHGEPMEQATVRGYCEAWLAKREAETRPATALFYRKVVRDWLAWYGERADNDLRTVTSKEILAYREDTRRRVTAKTVNHDLKTLRMIFAAAKRERIVVENPAADVDTLPVERSERRPFTEAEIRAVLSVADPEWQSMILFGLYTGQRLRDVASLTWQNVDFQRGEVRLVTSKTGRRQIVPMHPALRRHVESLPAGDDPHAPIHPRAFEVVGREGKTGTLSRQFAELLAQAGLAPKELHRKGADGDGRQGRRRKSEISFHSLRYTVTSFLQSAGVGQAVSQEIVGHESEAIHAIYTRINRDTLQHAIDLLPDVTAGAK